MEQKYWTSLSQFENDPTFLEIAGKEFISSPLIGKQESKDQPEGDKGGLDRRDFMKLMAASTAMATAACYQKPMHKILPYVNQPEEVTFGVANYYASTCGECATGCGTLVKTREGRPIKLEGNPDHPMNKGGLCARGQASILGLYDPYRLRAAMKISRGNRASASKTTWEAIDKEIGAKLKNGSIRLLSETINSPSTLRLTKDFLSGFSNANHVVYDSIGADSILAAQEASYGTKVLPRYNFSKANVVVSIDADFLGTWISPVEFTKQFSATRKINKKKKTLSKLYTFETMMTITGSNADERFAVKPTDTVAVALALANELQSKGLSAGSGGEGMKSFTTSKVSQMTGIPAAKIKKVAEDLYKSRGHSLVVGGASSGMGLQMAVNLLNSMLGNDGTTVDYSTSPSMQAQGSSAALTNLIKELEEGKVTTLIIYRTNPVYSLPENSGFAAAMAKAKNVIYIGLDLNETSVNADYILADHHSLESWGDAEPQKNLFSIMQPTIRPIYETRSYQDSLIALSKAAGLKVSRLNVEDFHEYMQKNWQDTVYKNFNIKTSFQTFWETTLRDGIYDGVKSGREKTAASRSFKGNLNEYLPKSSPQTQAVFYTSISMHDGSNADNPWLQELPDPITRMTWDNYASVSPNVAKSMGLRDGDIVAVTVKDKTFEIPSQVQPGLNDGVVAIALGYGRSVAGAVGEGVGKNVFKYTSLTNKGLVTSGFDISIKKTGEKYILATPQQENTLQGRPVIKQASFHEWLENPAAGNEEHEHLTTVWPEHKYEGYRWGMAIDLNTCTGCNACVVSCQSENNIPVVGKDSVNRGRIMHWMRIDRYYTGTPDNPQVVHQPMLCQHCENAPCETVCPVIATMHSDEGLNSQIYNRCVGTRYCANNCPYKVRRFNWFEYNYGGQVPYPRNLAQNPEVTVRARGIMEKCTFCIQRIHDAKNTARNMNRPVKDGEVKTACQQSCPADAIVFGDMNDPNSEVSQLIKDPRGFHVLEELNTRPSVTYLTQIRNTEGA